MHLSMIWFFYQIYVANVEVGVGGTPFLVLNEYFYQPSFKSSTQFQTARGACIRRPKKKIHRGKGQKVRGYRRGAVSNKLVPAAIARRSNCRNRLSIFWREARGGHVQQAMFQYLHREMEQGSEQNPTAEKAASSAMSDRQDTRT